MALRQLPDRGTVLGALAPVLVPGSPGARRSYTGFFAVVSELKAFRLTASAWISAATGGELRRTGRITRARQQGNAQRTHAVDTKLARGRSLVRAAAVVTVTGSRPIEEYGHHSSPQSGVPG